MNASEHGEFEDRIDAYLLGRLSPEEAERFEKHYFDCPECFRLAAERAALLEAVREAGPAPAPAASPSRTKRRAFPLGWAAAGAAVLLAAAVWLFIPKPPLPPDISAGPDRTVRGESLTTVAPAGVIEAAPKEFSWNPVAGAAEYMVVLEGVEPAWTAQTRETSVGLPDAVADRLVPGKIYSWKVKAFAAGGALLAASPETAFSVVR